MNSLTEYVSVQQGCVDVNVTTARLSQPTGVTTTATMMMMIVVMMKNSRSLSTPPAAGLHFGK